MSENILQNIIQKKIEKVDKLKKSLDLKSLDKLINKNNSYINLNDSASLIWGLIKTPTTKDSIIKKLLAITNAKPQTLKEDLDYFLKEAKDKDLINFSNEKKI